MAEGSAWAESAAEWLKDAPGQPVVEALTFAELQAAGAEASDGE